MGPSATSCGDEVIATVDFGANNPHPPREPGCAGPPGMCGLWDSAIVIAARLDMIDLRHYLPERVTDTNGTDLLQFRRPIPPGVVDPAETVGGAITDGASVCLMRLTPILPEGIFEPTVEINDNDSAQRMSERVYGGIRPMMVRPDAIAPGALVLDPIPALPVIDDPSMEGYHDVASIASGTCVWVPPEAYLDEAHNPAEVVALGNGESTWSGLRVRVKGVDVGRRPFNLRRPPIVLVHGLYGDGDRPGSPVLGYYWGPSAYNSIAGRPVPTRIYTVDYKSTHQLGYDANFRHIPLMIREALKEYWNANDRLAETNGPNTIIDPQPPSRKFLGIRHAATRADTIGHSMGGQLLRTYVSEVSGQASRGWDDCVTGPHCLGAWPSLDFSRHAPADDDQQPETRQGRWGHVRADNMHAGDVHRAVMLGSPFDGCPLGSLGRTLLESIGEDWWAPDGGLAAVETDMWAIGLSGALRRNYPGNAITNMISPNAIVDLAPQSAAQQLLEGVAPNSICPPFGTASGSAYYPVGRRSVAWYPVAARVVMPGAQPVSAELLARNMLTETLKGTAAAYFEDASLTCARLDLIGQDTSDGVVPLDSQLNRHLGIAGPPHSRVFSMLQHSHQPNSLQIEGENWSVNISDHVGHLLSRPRCDFNNKDLDK